MNIGYSKKTLSADQYELDASNLNNINAIWIVNREMLFILSANEKPY